MNQFYTQFFRNHLKLKKLAMIALLLAFSAIGVQAQNVVVTATAGVLGPTNYTNLKGAFDAINAGTHQGVIQVNIAGNTTETATAVLNGSAAPSNYSAVNIKPTGGVARVIQGNIAGALVKLDGADNVTIDGSLGGGGTRDLTFRNTNTSPSLSVVLWVASASASNGASQNSILNSTFEGSGPTTSFIAVVQSSGATIGGTAEAQNNSNVYANLAIKKALYGIALVGGSSANDIENTITYCEIGGAAADRIGWRGMFIAQQFNVLVSENTISGIYRSSGSYTSVASGIFIGGIIDLGTIENNKISDVYVPGPWGSNGILLESTSTNSGLVIQNNFIWDIYTGGYSANNDIADNAYGIGINSGGGYKIYYNSISTSKNPDNGASSDMSSAIWIGQSLYSPAFPIQNLDIRNNIFSNTRTVGTRYGINVDFYTNSIFSQINKNVYYSSSGNVGRLGGAGAANIVAWRAMSGQDAGSLDIDPVFQSATNLHLQGMSPLDGLAQPIAGITKDIDGDTRNTTTPDIGADEFTPPNCTNPTAGGTATSSVSEICGSGTPYLSSTGYSWGLGTTYQWEQSIVGATGPWTNVVGAIAPIGASGGNISATHWYRLKVVCSAGVPQYSNVFQVIVNNPQVTGTTPGTRCGIGTVNLSATGSNLRWYDVPTGGSALGTGGSFTTPVINATTTYYVGASSGGVFLTGGKTLPTYTGAGYTGDAGIIFDAAQAFTIQSVDIFPEAAGTITIEAITNTGATLPGCTWTGAVPATSPTVPVTITLNFPIPIGTDFRLIKRNFGISIRRDFSPNSFPYSLAPAATLISGVLGTTGNTNYTVYYYFYNWKITTACEGVRAPVLATVTNPPAITITPSGNPASNRIVCTGDPITLTASSAASPAYTYTWMPGNISGNSITVTPPFTSSYTVSANNGICRNDSVVVVTAIPAPTAISVTPVSREICINYAQPLVVTGGHVPDQMFLGEQFNSFPNTFTATDPSQTVTLNTTYFAEGSGSAHITYPNSLGDPGAGGWTSPSFSLPAGVTNPVLKFKHIAALEGTNTTNWDFGRVEYSLNGGTTWTTFPSTDYLGGGAVYQSTVSFNRSSYPDWNTTLNVSTAVPNNTLWKADSVSLATLVGFPNCKIRFRIKSDASVLYYGWLIDDVKITATSQGAITWAPFTNLYMDNGHTIPYTGQNTGTVYFWSNVGTAPQVYTATASNGGSCIKTATSTISTSSSTPSVAIDPGSITTYCQGEQISLTAIPTNGGPTPAYQWYVNGFPYFLMAHPDSVTTRFSPGSINNGDLIYVKMISPAVPPCPPANTNSAPLIAITINDTAKVVVNASASTVCSNAPVTLSYTQTPAPPVGPNIVSRQWYRNGVPVPGETGLTMVIIQFGDYQLQTTTDKGCVSISPVKTITQDIWNVDIQPGPNGSISPAGPVLSVPCGDMVTFTVTPNPGYNILSVFVDGVPYPATPGPHSFIPLNDAVVEAFFDISGCPTPPTSFAGSNISVCASTGFYLLASQGPNIGGTATSATWSTSGTGTFYPNNIFGPGNATHYIFSSADTAAGSVNITLTTNNPGAPCIASTSTFTLTLTPSPIINTTGVLGYCDAGITSTTLTANTSFSAGTINGYQWYRILPSAATLGTTPIETISTAGQYRVVALGSNGCNGIDTLDIVKFNPPTADSITGVLYFCVNGSTTILGESTPGDAPLDPNGYLWEFNDIPPPPTFFPVSGAVNQALGVSSIGSYRFKVTDMNGCQSVAYSPNTSVTYETTPMSGNYTIGMGPGSCTNFISFEAAIDALNTRTINGNCIFEVANGYTEVVPTGGLKLGSTALNPTTNNYSILFTPISSGANPLLIAYNGGTATGISAQPDGIWSLNGVDNVIINKIDFTDDTIVNTTDATRMEYAVGLFKRINNDGAKNNSIQNCNITLYRNHTSTGTSPMPSGSTGILMLNTTYNAATTPLTPTNTNGSNSNNKFYNNNITEVGTGIYLFGYDAPSPFTLADKNNEVGGSLATEGNIIMNFGRTVSGASNATGVFSQNEWDLKITQNTIKNQDGTAPYTIASLRGIWNEQSNNASGTIGNNTITLERDTITTVAHAYGIDTKYGNDGTNNTVQISNNVINVKSGKLGIQGAGAIGIYFNLAGAAGPATLNINNNQIDGIELRTTSVVTLASAFGIYNNSINSNTNISGNIIKNITKFGPGGSVNAMAAAGIYQPSTAAFTGNNFTIANNEIYDVSVNTSSGNSYAAGIYVNPAPNATATLTGNTIRNIHIKNAASAQMQVYGITSTSATNVNAVESLQGNIIDSVYIDDVNLGAQVPFVFGMFFNNNQTGSDRVIAQNTISNIFTTAGTNGQVMGIGFFNGKQSDVRRNHVSKLFAGRGSAGTASIIRGVYLLQNSGVGSLVNNFVSIDLTQDPDVTRSTQLNTNWSLVGIENSSVANIANDWSIYYNTVRIAGAGNTNFGAAAFLGTQATTIMDLRNNIFANYAVPSGTGFAAAIRRNAGPAGYALTSNNNLYFTTQTATTPIAHFQSTAYVTLPIFKSSPYVAGREAASIADEPIFVDVANNDLHIDPSANCTINGGAQPIAGITVDYDFDTRDAVKPDIGADEFVGLGGIAYTWKGVNTDWEDAVNWCPGVPDEFTDVTIPSGATYYPILTTTTNIAGNIDIQPGGRITINTGATLTVRDTVLLVDGVLTNNGDLVFDAGAGVAQSLDGSGTFDPMNTVIVNNTAGFTIKRPITIYGELRPTKGNITVNETVTLKSSATQTAQVSALGSGVSIFYGVSGRFSVENYIAASGNEAWRFISAPIQTGAQTIRQAWMENQTAGSYTATGYGMQIVGPTSAGTGFDQNTRFPSIKTYDYLTNNWLSTAGTNVEVSNLAGYMVFVRGDRGSNTLGSTSNTTLRVAGKIKTGNVTVNGNGVANTFFSVGNPYPSALDFANVTRTNVNNYFYVWDPKLGTYGGYQTLTWAGGGYVATPGSGSYSGGNDRIESGQAFIVYSTNATSSVMMKEGDKISGSYNVTRAEFNGKALTTRLYSNNNQGGYKLIDGTRNEFDNVYSTAIDNDDAQKVPNFDEGLGLNVNNTTLAVERRAALVENDTIYYSTTGLRQQAYRLEFFALNMSEDGLQAWLEDNYLGTRTPISFEDSARVDFIVDGNPGSAAINRFRLVFKVMAPVPVTFVSVDAAPVNKDIRVRFRVANEINIQRYTVERSVNARDFIEVGEVAANGNRSYEFTDVHPGSGTFFYRIRSNGFVPGDVKYSNIATATIGTPSTITIYPNPVKEDRIVKVKMENMERGIYNGIIYNSAGQEIYREKINHPGGDAVYVLPIGKLLVRGTYLLQVIDEMKRKTIVKFVY